jgi:flagellar hook-associated protein 2
MASTSTNLISALGAGSGVDVKALAESLVEAERAPRKEIIDKKITQTEARISGYGALKFALSELQTAFKKLNDTSDFNSVTAASSQPTAVGITTNSSATPGIYNIEVSRLAQATRWATESMASSTSALNSGSAFDLTLTVGGTATAISVATDTPAGIVSAVNAKTADTGISAQLINTGSAYKLVFTGQEGADNDFTITSTAAGLTMSSTALQTAQDAKFSINDIEVTSSTNTVSDAMDGITLNLYAVTTSAARVTLTQDTSAIKTNLKGLVTAYNEFADSVNVLGDRASAVEEFGGALAGDSLLQTIKTQVRSMMTGDFTLYTDSTNLTGAQNTNLNAAWQVGLSFDRDGKLNLDETTLDTAFANYPDELITLFTADTNNLSAYSSSSAGLAGTAVRDIDKLLRSTGLIAEQTTNANKKLDQFRDDLLKIEERMTALNERYMKQFSLMESMVGSSTKMREGMKSSFDGMMAAYTKG